MPVCAALGCCNTGNHEPGKVRFFRFPTGTCNEDRRHQWLKAVCPDNYTATENSRICEDHFRNDQYEATRADGRRFLKKSAIPTLCKLASCQIETPNGHDGGQDLSLPRPELLTAMVEKATGSGTNTVFAPCNNTAQDVVDLSLPQPELLTAMMQQVAGGSTEISTCVDLAVQATNHSELIESETCETQALTPWSNSTEIIFEEYGVQDEVELLTLPASKFRKVVPLEADASVALVQTSVKVPALQDKYGQGDKQDQIDELQRKVNLLQKKNAKLQNDLCAIKEDKRGNLRPDQLRSLSNMNQKSNRWSDQTIKHALKLRLACGSRGYNLLKQSDFPLPSERTLQRRIEDLKFLPGVLDELLPALECKVSSMLPQERHCVLLVDEMQLEPGMVFDPSTRTTIGAPTIAQAERKRPRTAKQPGPVFATHGLVFMLAGLSARWKQTICYHFSGNSISGSALKKVVFEIIEKCEATGLALDAITSDMGSSNMALWNACGVMAPKMGKQRTSCPHPCRGTSDRELFFVADAPHILKNIRSHLVKGQQFILPSDIVEKYELPTSEVSITHVKALAEVDESLSLKLAPRLKQKYLDLKHYDKMSVSSALAVLNHAVAAGIRTLEKMGYLTAEALTTAWFIEQVFKWFSLMSSRKQSTAISEANPKKYAEARLFLEEFSDMFRRVSICGPGQAPCFKPVQCGVLVTTTSSLKLEEILRKQHGFRFVFLSRLSQDALENLFSTVRSCNPVPGALEFKNTLRSIVLSQFFNPSSRGNYAIDDGTDLLDFATTKVVPRTSSAHDEHGELGNDSGVPLADLSELEGESLGYLSGYVCRAMIKRYKLCPTCRSFLRSNGIEECNTLLSLKSYRQPTEENPLFCPPKQVNEMLKRAESIFREHEHIALKCPVDTIIDRALSVLPTFDIPTCHSLRERLVGFYILLRLRIYLRKLNNSVTPANGRTGSRSVGMRVLAEKVV